MLFNSISPQSIVPRNTLSSFIQKGALAFEYNIIMAAIQDCTVLGLLHQRLIFCLPGLCTLTEFSWEKIKVHFLQLKWYFCKWFFQVSLPFGTREMLFHFISCDVQYVKQGSMEHHKDKSSWLSSKYIYLFKKEKDSFPQACLYINPAQGHI